MAAARALDALHGRRAAAAAPRGAPAELRAPAQHAAAAPGEVLLRVDGAEKRFGGLVAVNRVSFEVRGGEIVALLGPTARARARCST